MRTAAAQLSRAAFVTYECVCAHAAPAIRRSADTQGAAAGVKGVRAVTGNERDLIALAAIVCEKRSDLPDKAGLPPSLLADLMAQVRCDVVAFATGFDSERQATSSCQFMQDGGDAVTAPSAPVNWEHYWHCQPCSYPDRTGDLRSIVTIADFYSARQWLSIGSRCGINKPMGFEHSLMLTMPAAPGQSRGPGRTARLFFFRSAGPGFAERDRAMLTLLRPHLLQTYLDAERHLLPAASITPKQREVLRLVAAGCTNTQIARQLGVAEGTVRTHLENIYRKLQVTSRTAAVTRAFPQRVL
jgi:DNA-binding CsgD family transcriptional regulator